MKRLDIYKSGILTNQLSYETDELLEQGFEYHKSIGSFGGNGYSYQSLVSEEVPAQYEEQEVLDENGQSFDPPQFETVEVSPAVPAVYEEIVVPADYTFTITDITEELALEKIKQDRIEAGEKARKACQAVLDLVSGYNLDRELTIEQITQMQQTFSTAEAALRAGRPTFAKSFITAIEADEVLVTQEMKDLCLSILGDY
jgi:hypothetical protein